MLIAIFYQAAPTLAEQSQSPHLRMVGVAVGEAASTGAEMAAGAACIGQHKRTAPRMALAGHAAGDPPAPSEAPAGTADTPGGAHRRGHGVNKQHLYREHTVSIRSRRLRLTLKQNTGTH